MSGKDDTANRLREWFPKGSTVYTILRHRSKSGMSRTIGLVAILTNERGEIDIRHPNYAAAEVLGWKLYRDRDGLKVGGGMDMGFHLVYTLSSKLYGDGYTLKHEWL